MSVTSPPRANLNDQVYETLKQRLVRRELGPGEKVSLHELAAELGVSRSPVHHALTRLVAEGLLTVKSRRGYYVTALTEAAIAEGYEVRLALELQAAEAAVGRVGRDDAPPVPRAARDDRRSRLARGVGHRQRRLPRVPGRPRGEHACSPASTAISPST